MRRIFTKIVIALSLLLSFSLVAEAEPQTYTLDPGHTYVLWHINHFGFSNPSGKWMADGTLILDEAKPQDSKLNVNIHLAGLTTGIPKLDEHLNSPDFFDATKFPVATYVSDKVVLTGKDTAKVYGNLNVHGISKPVILDVKLNKIGVSPITQKKTAGFTATAELNRSDFGISKYLPGLGDAVKINIEAEADLETPKAG